MGVLMLLECGRCAGSLILVVATRRKLPGLVLGRCSWLFIGRSPAAVNLVRISHAVSCMSQHPVSGLHMAGLRICRMPPANGPF